MSKPHLMPIVFALCCSLAICAEPPTSNKPTPCKLPSPDRKVAAALPGPTPPARYEFSLNAAGGFTVTVKGTKYPVESSYSFPHGGENLLGLGAANNGTAEAAWKVHINKLDENNYQVVAEGDYYHIDRRITLHANRIAVRDTMRNKRPQVLGIILANYIKTGDKPAPSVLTPRNYTIFIAAEDHGLAMVGLDDVYQLQQATHYRDKRASMVTDKFGLDGHASYTIEWAIYPTATSDYLKFVNTFRKVERLNRTIEGAFSLLGKEGLTGPKQRALPFNPEAVRAKGVKYASYFYLIAPPDDPGMSLEGIEFTEYPQESAMLKKSVAESHRLNPGIKVMFHIAHGLYACNNPVERFPDSRVIRADGRQIMYGGNNTDYYRKYFSKQRVDEGNRWYIFYPTMQNSFGKAMLAATDYMLEHIGTSGMYADGFVRGYSYVDGNTDGYTHDTWDGHSVLIDAKTKTIKRKIGNVALMSLPVLKAVVRKVAAKGGIVVTNGESGPRSLWHENYLTTCESDSGDNTIIQRLYIGPTITPFGAPSRIKNRQDLYLDVLAKLKHGALYFYLGDKDYAVKEKMIVRHMYPFTREETHAGWAKGRERIVTMVSGSYGWRGDRHLHRVYRSDAQGNLVPNKDFSTADSTGIRTELKLGKQECAVVEKIPVEIETDRPLNVLVNEYGRKGFKMHVNGKANAQLTLTGQKFPILAGKTYRVNSGSPNHRLVKAHTGGKLILPLNLDGETNITISPE